MASTSQPRIYTFRSTTAMGKGLAVKIGATRDFVSLGAANTDKLVGITQGVAQGIDERIEVAMQGGGAKALAGGTIAAGDKLTSNASGALITSTTPGTDRIVGVAMEAAVAGDIFYVEVVLG